MTAISYFFDKAVERKRLVAVAGTDNEEYEETLSGISCCIQPLDDSFGEDLEGSYGKDFLMFCGIHDIQQEDKIIDGAIEYRVVGVESHSFVGQKHMELRIRLCK